MSNLKETFKVLCMGEDGVRAELMPTITQNGDEITLRVTKEQINSNLCYIVRVESSLTTVQSPADGYMFFPTNYEFGVPLCRFDKKEDAEFHSLVASMPVCGICENENAVFVHVQSMDSYVSIAAESKSGVYSLSPEFFIEGEPAEDDIVIVYKKMPNATYSDMARHYRKYQLEVKGCVPIKERIKTRPALKEATESIELRIRMGWKPQPTPVRRQTLENEPPMKVACDIPTLNKIIDKMKEKNVKGAEICLVGWGPGGHDGRFPQHYPCDERFGTDDDLRAFIKKAESYGYVVTCHSNSKGAYEIAENWDKDLIIERDGEPTAKQSHALALYGYKTTVLHNVGKTGEPKPWLRPIYTRNGLQGGDPWHVCPKAAYENYAVKDFPVIRDYGFRGLHYVDELTAEAPVKCESKKHPVTRKQTIEYYRKIAQLSTQLFGGFATEAWCDFMSSDVDYILFTSSHSELTHEQNPLFDELIPFWVLTYHGIVLSNATSKTTNYTIKGVKEHLQVIEFGSRPLMYINSLFCGRDWMGKVDLFCDTDEAIETTVDAIKVAEDEYETLKHLQYEFIDNHEKLSDTVYRVTYSDGTVITVDYSTGEYSVKAPENK